MEERVEAEKAEDVVLPGFRFHPTDEELVGFYLKRKIQQRRLPIELIKQVDIYKYDPWDLPKVAANGEKEWYFYCPRDRKYRNSARPNRVTGAGFWKATGTDRPIYSSSDATNCIGLKKSLVFYRGRAAKGFKTDWMMHEFRLPPSVPPSSFSHQSFPPGDSWAICRIFKKTSSMSQRAISQSWMTSLLEPTTAYITTKLSSDNISSTPRIRSAFDFEQVSDGSSFSAVDFPSFKHLNHPGCKSPLFQGNFCNGFTIPPLEVSGSNKCAFDSAPGFSLHNSIDLTQDADSVGFEGGVQEQPKAFSISFSNEMTEYEEGLRRNGDEVTEMTEYEEGLRRNGDEAGDNKYNPMTSINFSFSLSTDDAWKSDLEWDSPPFTSEMSTSCSTTKCYT